MNAQLSHYLSHLELKAPRQVGPLTLLPLTLKADFTVPPLVLLDDESARVIEVNDAGRVNRIKVENLTPEFLLLLNGELVRGARQNRLVNATTLITGGGEHLLSVSCVEQGRWAYGRQRGFAAAEATVPWTMRSESSLRSSRSKRRQGRADANQRQVWEEVAAYLRQHNLQSDTMDLFTMVDRADTDERQTSLLPERHPLAPADDEVGAALFLGSELVGLEAFAAPKLWQAAHARVLRGLQLEARGVTTTAPEQPLEQAQRFLASLTDLQTEELPGEAAGIELHAERDRTHLMALVSPEEEAHAPAVVHLRVARRMEETRPTPDPAPEHREDRGRERYADRGRAIRRGMPEMRAKISLQAHEPDGVTVQGAFLAVHIDELHTVMRRASRLSELPPLPHQTGGGIAVWMFGEDQAASRDVRLLLQRLGIPREMMVRRRDLRDPPGWLIVSRDTNGERRLSVR